MLFLLFATCSSALVTIALRTFQSTSANRFGILLGNYLVCVLISFLSLPDRSIVFRGMPVTLICGIIGGILFVLALVAMQTSIRLNGATLTAVFTKLGLVVSLAVSIIAFGERPGILQILGVLLALAALILINGGGAEENNNIRKPHTASLLLTMFVGGCASVMAKVFEQVGPRSEDELYYLYLFGTAAVMTFLLAMREGRKNGTPLRIKEMASGITVGIPNYYSSFLLLKALVALPAFVVFPVNSIGSLLLITVADAIFFRERHSGKQKLGILLVVAALILLHI